MVKIGQDILVVAALLASVRASRSDNLLHKQGFVETQLLHTVSDYGRGSLFKFCLLRTFQKASA